ncbi:L,D-transpeptidase [Bacillus subtilis]|uniref:L,D-transpeptidase n=1 Tax=Pseudochrobactrum asaccharolyticum TaxID=354351 RepID=UPI001F2BCE21|nr:L,D-transpeptidase [Pseudochrobactrum asaccharolyticum]MCF7645667.1 L,D-transpeptidase [Pseudochrobactrum asaccharolyticum]MCF7671268.1 L,D-transpeptidase [Bacillus subtilis]
MISSRILIAGFAGLCLSFTALTGLASAQTAATESVTEAAPKAAKSEKKKAPAQKVAKTKYNIDPKYQAQTVAFSGYPVGTIVVDPSKYFLYLVETPTTARRYGIAVGKVGLEFKGSGTINAKREWPRWIPTADMVKRNPQHYGRIKNGMDGGMGNPLGSRALYLFQGNKDTYIRIHGTVQPWTIGSAASNGCFRMTNEDVMELYERVNLGATVVVL